MAGEFKVLWQNLNNSDYALDATNLSFMLPSFNFSKGNILAADLSGSNKRTIKVYGDGFIKMISNGIHTCYKNGTEMSFTSESLLDEGAILSPATNYYVYLVQTGNNADIVVSKNGTFPVGATADNSRKIGGFHTLCVDVGTITDHPLTSYIAGDILPASVWDLIHRPVSNPEAMVFDPYTKIWVDIYLQSGTGVNTASVYGGTVTKSRRQDQHTEDFFLVGKTLLSTWEFASAMEGSNQQTAIKGAADPITTGGHVDTAGRRMISNIGVEDGCGAYWQWTRDLGPAGDSGWNGSSLDGKGQQYGNVYAVIAGGYWGYSVYCGSRCLAGNSSQLNVGAYSAGRGCSPAKYTF